MKRGTVKKKERQNEKQFCFKKKGEKEKMK